MIGRLKTDQGQLFYEFRLNDAVPEDHLVRKIDTALDPTWLRDELAPHYSSMGRPSIDPELMIRMLVVGYVFAIRSERMICREVQVNLAYRWFCRLGIEDGIPDHSAFSRALEGDPRLINRYDLIELSPQKHGDAKLATAKAFADWLVSPEGQEAIGAYQVNGQKLFNPSAGSPK
jgi:transposase